MAGACRRRPGLCCLPAGTAAGLGAGCSPPPCHPRYRPGAACVGGGGRGGQGKSRGRGRSRGGRGGRGGEDEGCLLFERCVGTCITPPHCMWHAPGPTPPPRCMCHAPPHTPRCMPCSPTPPPFTAILPASPHPPQCMCHAPGPPHTPTSVHKSCSRPPHTHLSACVMLPDRLLSLLEELPGALGHRGVDTPEHRRK